VKNGKNLGPGGAVAVMGGTFKATNSWFSNNEAADGGALTLGGGTMVLDSCLLTDNLAKAVVDDGGRRAEEGDNGAKSGMGGGILVTNCDLLSVGLAQNLFILNTTISDNTGDTSGGLAMDRSPCGNNDDQTLFKGCVFLPRLPFSLALYIVLFMALILLPLLLLPSQPGPGTGQRIPAQHRHDEHFGRAIPHHHAPNQRRGGL
jgi:hypothetical protein